MNEIVSKGKSPLLEELEEDDYKLIYPNDLNLIMTMEKDKDNIIYLLSKTSELNFFELLRNKNKLFLSWKTTNILPTCRGPLELKIREFGKPGDKKVKIHKMLIYDEKGEKYRTNKWSKRIKEIYMNSAQDSIVIIIDENFLFPRERKELKAEEIKYNKRKSLENKINSLLK